MRRARLILALACGVGMTTGRLDAAVFQGPNAAGNIRLEVRDLIGDASMTSSRIEFRMR